MKPIIPDRPGWWWLRIRETDMEPVRVRRRGRKLAIEVAHPGFKSTWLEVEHFTWLGSVNMTPVVP